MTMRNSKTSMISVTLVFAGIATTLAACSDPSAGRPPSINSGSYDWQDAYRGSDGYPLPGWGGFFKPNS
jgi:hypothetical protein